MGGTEVKVFSREKRDKPKKNPIREMFSALIWAAVLAAILRSTVACAYYVPSGSMLPTLQIGDQMLVNAMAYGVKLPIAGITLIKTSQPQRGDIVVFANPDGAGPDYVKRIIGLPGETLQVDGQRVFINSKALDDHWAHIGRNSPTAWRSFGPVTVPAGHYFMMGDNRASSYDSRFWNHGQGGFVPLEDIRGKVVMILWTWKDLPSLVSLERSGTMFD